MRLKQERGEQTYLGGCIAFLIRVAHLRAEGTDVDDDRTSIGVIVVVRVFLILELHVGKASLRHSKRCCKVGLDVAAW
jgi:hypothetical protein